ncbi:DedA family protein [Muricoccus radiodurans]|uniref:DedA family protein n=1 Tax=Muricoccus radiodurans TaxID=2231721 RepID=UPI003CE7FAF4
MFDGIVTIVRETGYFGILLLMLAENVFPPIPSELIMPMAGFSAARGDLQIVLVILAGTAGSVLGALFWYGIGRWVGHERLKRWSGRHGRWLTISPEDVDRASDWFGRHGAKAVLIGRIIPAVRTLISVPAGLTRMPLVPFLLFSVLGTTVWTALLAGAGYLLQEQYEVVSRYVNPVSNLIVIGIGVYYLYRVMTFRRAPT